MQVAQWPMEPLGLVVKELVALAMREEGQVLTVVLKLEEGVGQVEKVVPPSSFLRQGLSLIHIPSPRD